MCSLREMRFEDLLKFNALVFDPLTEVYGLKFFLCHLIKWPALSLIALAPDGQQMGYIFGKFDETLYDLLHGHVCALTVSMAYRRLGLGSTLMNYFAKVCQQKGCWYVDLFMRQSNEAAYNLYRALGFSRQRLVFDYYAGKPPENAYDMRKQLTPDGTNNNLNSTYK